MLFRDDKMAWYEVWNLEDCLYAGASQGEAKAAYLKLTQKGHHGRVDYNGVMMCENKYLTPVNGD